MDIALIAVNCTPLVHSIRLCVPYISIDYSGCVGSAALIQFAPLHHHPLHLRYPPHTSWHREPFGQDHAGFVIIGIGNVPWVLGYESGALRKVRHIDHEGHCYRKGKSSWYSRFHEFWGCGVYISNSVGKEKRMG